jgi:hypothetical protein
MSDKFSIPMSLPVDSDGFLRREWRECPTCEREMRWLVAPPDEDAVPDPEGGFYCPYCGVQAPPEGWWTKAQLQFASETAAAEVVAPKLRDFADDYRAAQQTWRNAPYRGEQAPNRGARADERNR